MRALVKKRGNGGSVRIPATIIQAEQLELHDAVELREEPGRIDIEPIQLKEYALQDLLDQITHGNLHEAVFGASMGKESW